MATPKLPEDDDPVLAAEMERALRPYEGLVPPQMLLVLRDILRNALTEHPVGRTLLDRVRALERVPPSKSGAETKPGLKVVPTGAKARGRTSGGKE
jgi:hypothetical protein